MICTRRLYGYHPIPALTPTDKRLRSAITVAAFSSLLIVVQSRQFQRIRLPHYSSHTRSRTFYISQGIVDSFRCVFAQSTSMPQACRLISSLGGTRAAFLKHNGTISAHASALYTVLISGVLTVTRGPTLSRHAGVSVVSWRRSRSIAHIARTVVLAWSFLCRGVVKPTRHASTSLQ